MAAGAHSAPLGARMCADALQPAAVTAGAEGVVWKRESCEGWARGVCAGGRIKGCSSRRSTFAIFGRFGPDFSPFAIHFS